jgi:hypothetical protein
MVVELKLSTGSTRSPSVTTGRFAVPNPSPERIRLAPCCLADWMVGLHS